MNSYYSFTSSLPLEVRESVYREYIECTIRNSSDVNRIEDLHIPINQVQQFDTSSVDYYSTDFVLRANRHPLQYFGNVDLLTTMNLE